MRKRLGKNTNEFAELLGTTAATISRYESGSRRPGLVPLEKLLDLAEGTERGPIHEAMALIEYINSRRDEADDNVGRPVRQFAEEIGRQIGVKPAAIERRLAQVVREYLQRGDTKPRRVLPELAAFADASDQVIRAGREVDHALVEVLSLWITHSRNPAFREALLDAVRFLKISATKTVKD